MKKRNSNKGKGNLEIGMAGAAAAVVKTEDGNLDALMASLEAPAGDEIVETAEVAANESTLEAAVADAERITATQEAYATQGTEPAVTEMSAANPPTTDDAPTTEAAAEAPAPAAAKKERKARVTYSKQSERIAARMGEKLSEFTPLLLSDASLDPEAVKADTLAIIDKMAKKVGEKAAMLFDFLKDGGDLNEVMAITFKTLKSAGELTSGDKGNLQQALLAKPYSMGTSRSQANQMFMLLPALKLTVKEKGKMVANPDSLLLAAVNGRLGL